MEHRLTQTSYSILTYMYKSTQMHGLIKSFSLLLPPFSVYFFFTPWALTLLITPKDGEDTDVFFWLQPTWCAFLNACRLSFTSPTSLCTGTIVLSPSPPHWANWKRKVPPAVNACPRGYACSGYEQLMNNYCFYRPSRGTCHIYRMVRVLKWVCSLNYCWNTVFE